MLNIQLLTDQYGERILGIMIYYKEMMILQTLVVMIRLTDQYARLLLLGNAHMAPVALTFMGIFVLLVGNIACILLDLKKEKNT